MNTFQHSQEYAFDHMSHRSARLLARRRTLVLVCLVALVWCQMMAFAHASSLAVAQLALDPAAELMALMPDCDDADSGEQSKPPCPTSEAAPDWSKLAVLHAAPLGKLFALVAESERGFAGPVQYGLPHGRAPPRALLCCWLF